MKIIYLLAFDLLYFAALYPLNVTHPADFIGDLRQYYDKLRMILHDVITQHFQSSNGNDPYQFIHTNRRQQYEIPPGMTSGELKELLMKHGKTLPPGQLQQIMEQNKKKKEASYFDNLKGAPYWPGNEELYDRTVEPRYISPTVPEAVTGTTTNNPDCNHDCLKILEAPGLLCAHRLREMRKELFWSVWMGIFDFILIGKLFGWSPYYYTDDDNHNFWEYREFDNICDMEYENCRNKTHKWSPAYFGNCKRDLYRNRFQWVDFRTARHNTDDLMITHKQTWDFYAPTTGIWMLYE